MFFCSSDRPELVRPGAVEALAEELHGDVRRIVKIDCGEFQHEHEVAKLIGVPPVYVGHAQTEPRRT